MRYTQNGGFRARLARFFMGRNGPDALYYLAFALSLLAIFFGGIFAEKPWLRLTFSALYFVFFGYGMFRFFSRNIAKRRRENAVFLRAWRKLTLPFRRVFLRIRDRKTHIFRKCPACKCTLRLSRIPGEHTVRCPSCGNRFPVNVKK